MPRGLLFADTFYWVALLNPRDASHARVTSFASSIGSARLVTTDEVLTEVLNWFSRFGPHWRSQAVALTRDLRSDADVDVLPQTRADFDAAVALFEARPDKDYSLTDCRSMLALRAHGISEVLTNDHHFSQVGPAVPAGVFFGECHIGVEREQQHPGCEEAAGVRTNSRSAATNQPSKQARVAFVHSSRSQIC